MTAQAKVKALEWPADSGLSDWPGACPDGGERCARTEAEPTVALTLVAAALGSAGIPVSASGCGPLIPTTEVRPFSTGAVVGPRDCVAVARVGKAQLVVVARSELTNVHELPATVPLGFTALHLEWDLYGQLLLEQDEPTRLRGDFAPLSGDDIASLPAIFRGLACSQPTGADCGIRSGYLDASVGGGSAYFGGIAEELRRAGFLLTALGCPAVEESGSCHLRATRARPRGLVTVGLREELPDGDGPPRLSVLVTPF